MKKAQELPDELLKELYGAAIEFQKVQPWRWMLDSHLFGVKNPESDEVGYCCVMGNAGQHFALGVYLGSEGLDGYLRMLEGHGRDDDVLQYQKCLMASFEDRSSLSERDLKAIKKLGLKFRGKNVWPQFRSYRPGYFPWYLTAEESRFLIIALRQAIDVALRFKEDQNLLEDNREGLLLRIPGKTEAGVVWEDARIEPEPYEEWKTVLKIDDSQLAKFRQAMQIRPGVWEAGFFFGRQPLTGDEEDRPYFPICMLWCDQASSMILKVHLGKPKTYAAEFQAELLNLAASFQALPSEIQVSSDEAFDLLEPILKKLGVQLKQVRRLKAVQSAKREVFTRMGF